MIHEIHYVHALYVLASQSDQALLEEEKQLLEEEKLLLEERVRELTLQVEKAQVLFTFISHIPQTLMGSHCLSTADIYNCSQLSE